MRNVVISGIWALNCWYLAGFAHALAGLPNVGPIIGLFAFAAALLLLRPRSSRRGSLDRVPA
jgi:hypothetical protein